MDFDAIGENILPIVIILGLIILQFYLGRRRRGEKTQRGVVQSLLLEVRLNQALLGTADQREKPKAFEVTSWKIHKNRIDFLSQSLQGALNDAYMIIEDFNQQIKVTKKYKSAGYLVGVDVDKLKEPLNKSREGLEQWLLSATGSKEPATEYRSMWDSLFGGR